MAFYLDPKREMDATSKLLETIRDLAGDDEELRLDMVEGQTRLFDVLDALLVKDLETASLLAGLDEAQKVIDFRRERFKARAQALRATIEQAMMLLEVKKLERPTATLSLAERKPKVCISDEAALPSRFFKSEPKLDKKALNEAVLSGEEIAGAYIDNGTVSLTVRRK